MEAETTETEAMEVDVPTLTIDKEQLLEAQLEHEKEQEVIQGVIEETVTVVIPVAEFDQTLEGEVLEDADGGKVDELIESTLSLPVPGAPLICNICEQQFGRPSHLTRHIEACHGERGTQCCPHCTATFNRKDSLNRHIATQHAENPRRFKCTVVGCDKDFNRKDHFNKHLRGVHKIEPAYSPSKGGGAGTEDDNGSSDDETPMIMEISSLRPEEPTYSTSKDKKFKCSNHGCGVEYTSLHHLHRHMSRGHSNSELQFPVWGHSIFGDAELKLDGGDIEGDATLCMFCCSTYQHNLVIEKQRKTMLANDSHFTKFCEAALRQQRKRMSANTIIKSLNSLNKLSVCQRCFNTIGYAMGTKVAADEVEARVETLRRQLDAELKNLQSEVDQFYGEMKMIEEMIRSSDMSSLESYLAGIETPEEKEQSSVVLLLRDGIFAVMNDVEIYCKRIRGQQIVVNTPHLPVRRSTGGGTPVSSKKAERIKQKKKRKLKHKGKLDPLLHVKVEQGPGGDSNPVTPAAEDSDKEDTDVDKSVLGLTETPRRQPVREARVRTEEFLRNLFEKQKVGDELDAVVKTEVPSDTEGEGVEPGEALPTDTEKVDDKEGGEGEKAEGEGEAQYKGKKEKAKAAAAASTSATATPVFAKKSLPELKDTEDGKEASAEGEKEDAAGKDAAPPKTPPPIEEILIDGDDELDDLFYNEDETSDEDFNVDATQDDFDSKSESSDSDMEETSDEEDDSDYEEEQPAPKRKRGGTPRGRTAKPDFDPFKFRKTSKSQKGTKIKSNNKLAQQHNIDMSGMSEFRQRLLCRILKKNNKSSSTSPVPDPLSSGEPDPRVNFRFEYNKEEGTLVLGDVHVIIHDEHSSLQCSKCGYLSSPAEKPRRSVPRIMYNHILGKHLFAFQCPQCSATLGSYRRYLDHIKGHQMGFMCDICGKPLFSEEALRRHRWGHQNAEEMAEAIRQGIKDPRRKHDPNLTFQCTTCGKVFSKKMLLRQHEKTHAENRERIVCTLCGKTFLPSGFISHQKYSCFPEGYEPPRVQCQLCPSTFKSVVLRARHMKYAHSTASIEKPYKCHICGKGFAANEHLQKHIKRHSDARPYLCRKGCGANYKTRKDCTRHEKKCEGSGTPMMRHKGRNDQLAAVPVAKKEPEEEQIITPTLVEVQSHHPGPSQTVILQAQQPAQQQAQPQYNVYNIL